jgi:WD40 repeat protein
MSLGLDALVWGMLLMVMSACTASLPVPDPVQTPKPPATLAVVRSLTPVAGPLVGHQGYVWSVAFSPDGKVLASAGSDNAIILWDVSDPQRPVQLGAPLQGHTNWVVSLAFSPDGATLASGSWDGSIALWDVSDPSTPEKLGASLLGHTGSVYAVAFSPSAPVLASGGTDQTIVLWDVTDPRMPVQLGSPLSGHKAHVNSLAFSPNGEMLVSGSCAEPKTTPGVGYTCGKGEILFWDMTDYRAPRRIGKSIRAHAGEIVSLAFARGGELVASAGGDSIQLWEVGNLQSPGQPVASLTGHKYSVQSVVFSPTEDILASGGCAQEDESGSCVAGETIFWDVHDPRDPQRLGVLTQGHSNWVTSLAFSPDGMTLASGSWDGTVLLWDVSNW